MPFLITLVACGITAALVYSRVGKKYEDQLNDLNQRLQVHQDELAAMKQSKTGLQQECADLTYQLRETKKDLAATQRRLPSDNG